MWTMSDLLSSNFVNRSEHWAKKGRRLSGGGGGALAFMRQVPRWVDQAKLHYGGDALDNAAPFPLVVCSLTGHSL
jgi:hypothetical protein